jgi:hypothetical protein
MTATLIKKADGWYNLYQDKIGIGSTHSELQGYKLSKQNCDEIFGVVDVEKLAEYSVQEVKESNADFYLRDVYKEFFKEVFNKAMELNEDKLFTRDDVISAIVHHTYLLHNDGKGYDDGDTNDNRIDYVITALKQPPTEIEVEVEMETKKQLVNGYENQPDNVVGFVAKHKYILVPKLDADGCLILKTI